jgi:signal peptidase II
VIQPSSLVLLWGVAAVAVLGLAWLEFSSDLVAQVGLGASLGGASGNLLDRLRRGAIVDFVDLRVWPVFNLADLAIVSGAAVVLWRASGWHW